MLTSPVWYEMAVALNTVSGPSTARQCLNTETTGGSQAFVGKRCCLLDNVALSKSLGCIALQWHLDPHKPDFLAAQK